MLTPSNNTKREIKSQKSNYKTPKPKLFIKGKRFFCKNNHISKTNEPSAIRQNIIHKGPIEKRITLMIAKPDPQTIPKNNSNDSGSNFFFISTIQNY